jgi:hypothetical protein
MSTDVGDVVLYAIDHDVRLPYGTSDRPSSNGSWNEPQTTRDTCDGADRTNAPRVTPKTAANNVDTGLLKRCSRRLTGLELDRAKSRLVL